MTAAEPGGSAPIARPLTGQKALVTGANSGIGRALAIALGQAGADVVVNYVTGEDRAQEVVRAIEQHGVKAYAHLADVSDETQVLDMLSAMAQRLGAIDVLFNNAGLPRDAPFHEMTLAQWNRVISVNLTGQFLCARAASWLASDKADDMVGATLFVDGGMTLFPAFATGDDRRNGAPHHAEQAL